MSKEVKPLVAEEPSPTLSMHPLKFALWLFMATIVMMFGAFTSAYIVRKGEGKWVQFELPEIFYISTGIILLSSLTMHWAYLSARKNELASLKAAIATTFVLGLGFLFTQWQGWTELVDTGVYFAGKDANASGSFLYVISGVHGLHIVSGLIVLLFALQSAFRFRIHSKNMSAMEMSTTYWHFLDALWIYLFVFLLINR